MRNRVSRLLAYIYMPAAYLILGIGIVALVLYPFWSIGQTFSNLLFSDVDTSAQVMNGATFVEPEIKTVQEQDDTISLEDIHWPNYGDEYGKLTCEKIGLDVYTYWGDDYELLRKGAGTFIGSGIPGVNRTILIAGHNTMEFTSLQNINIGDVITFTTTYGIYEYEITETKVLSSTDITAYDLSAKTEQLVMYTCYPFTALGSTDQRFFVYGKRISGPDLSQAKDGGN